MIFSGVLRFYFFQCLYIENPQAIKPHDDRNSNVRSVINDWRESLSGSEITNDRKVKALERFMDTVIDPAQPRNLSHAMLKVMK